MVSIWLMASVVVVPPNCPRNAVLASSKCISFAAATFNIRARSPQSVCAKWRHYCWCSIFCVIRPSLANNSKKMVWLIRSSLDDNVPDPSSPSSGRNGRTRLIRAIQGFQTRLEARIQEIRRGFPLKLLFFLGGFYCATAFATVIGQTGDWDILSAALAVFVVEGIGALMYRASSPFLKKIKSLITVFNFWKTGLALGLFLDSFKY
ncbi:hypothetical protein F8388_008537 [Cannabis sativa]|uniref:Ycf20-like protein n=2 Tax=Cannabis sativa TaxID=3483 RepID=A0A7J6EK16_CANSA|nr:hypothetical protein F8388_013854 [Cannabis sativa]KAF4358029.1 hypothetical protein F8388_008537 [Cannabis sativa]